MKKFLTFLLVFLMISSVAGAEEITFRGIPWGSSVSQVEQTFDEDIFFSTFDEADMPRWSSIQEGVDWEHIDDYPAGWEVYFLGLEGMKVAGYEAIGGAYCAYGLSDSCEVLKEKKDSVLYAGGYVFTVIDHKATYLDLKTKLNGLYGDGVEEVEDGESWYATANGSGKYHYEIRCTTWSGDNNTQVKLHCTLSDLDDPLMNENAIALWYGKSDADVYLEKLQSALYQEKLHNEQEGRNDDTSGL